MKIKTFDQHLDDHLEEMVVHLTIGQQPRPRKADERAFVLRYVSDEAWRASLVALSHIPRTKTPRLDLRRPRLYCEHRIPGTYVSQATVLLALLARGVVTHRSGPDVKVALVARPPEMRDKQGDAAWVCGSWWPVLDIAEHRGPWRQWLDRFGPLL